MRIVRQRERRWRALRNSLNSNRPGVRFVERAPLQHIHFSTCFCFCSCYNVLVDSLFAAAAAAAAASGARSSFICYSC